MGVLILDSGGRGHTFAVKLHSNPLCDQLYITPGSGDTHHIATNVAISPTSFPALKTFVLEKEITIMVVGPEDPLVEGVYDFFISDKDPTHVQVIGPSRPSATLEGNKKFAKELMVRRNIPTARYASFTKETVEEGCALLSTMKAPCVLEADGLTAGEGVVILEDLHEARAELRHMLIDAKFGQASTKVVIEEFLKSIEPNRFALTDGIDYRILPTTRDYKRIGEVDTGLNTGGVGAVSPVPFADTAFMQKMEERIVKPTVSGLQAEGIVYRGFVFIGLIKAENEPYVIEYNVRMGDPEAEVVLPRIESDLVPLFQSFYDGTLAIQELKVTLEGATTVVIVSGGYPEKYEKGKVITSTESVTDSMIYHTGTTLKEDALLTAGGRILAITLLGADFHQTLQKSHHSISKIRFKGAYYRRDIGKDLSSLQSEFSRGLSSQE